MTDLTSVNSIVSKVWPDWTVVDIIGSGPYGTVYKAVLKVNESCASAIKVLSVCEASDTADAIIAELERVSVLKSIPNAVSTEAYASVPSESGDRYDVLVRTELLFPIDERYSEKEAVKLGIDICMALEAAEKYRIVHGNIKPSNIFVTDVGTYKLGDFGISPVIGDASTDKTVYFGVPKYSAPEISGGVMGDVRSDIYSLGTVLYGLLPEAVCPELGEVLKKACADDPGERFASASDFKQALVNIYTFLMLAPTSKRAADPMITEIFDISDDGAGEDAYVKQLESSAEVQSHMEDDFDVEEYSNAFSDVSEADNSPIPYGVKKDKKKSKAPIVILVIVMALLLAGIIAFGAVKLVGIITGFSGEKITDETEDLGSVVSLTIEKLPEKLEYRLEEPIDLNGLVLKADYSDGSSSFITDGFAVSPKIAEYVGENEISIIYGDAFVTFNIDVSDAVLNTLIIAEMPERTVFAIGEEYDFTGLVLEASYADGETVSVTTGFECEPACADELGEQVVKVKFGKKSVDIPVTVTETTVKALVIKSLPSRLNYFVGEKLDPAGMRLNVTRTNGIMATVSGGFTVSPERFTKKGKQAVTITYGDKSVSFDVNVDGALLNNIEIASMPVKTSYYVGEAVVTDGLAINEVYTDGTVKKVTSGFTVSPTAFTSAGEQDIKVTYKGKTAVFKVTVDGVVITSVAVENNPARLDYTEGDTLDITGLTLLATYSNGITESVSAGNVTVSPTVLSTAGFVPITVSYGGKTTIFHVNVAEPLALSGKCGDNINWKLQRGTLTVSGKGEIGSFSYNDTPWSDYAGSISAVVVESGIVSIGEYAFSGLSAKKITLPDSVKSVADTSFYGCYSLAEFSVSSANRQLKSSGGILYSKDMTKLFAYPAAKSETSYETPASVTTVAGYEIFAGTPLREITLGESVYSVSSNAFSGAAHLEKINVRTRCTVLTSVDGVLYSKNMNELICYPAAKQGSSYTIPDTVKYIRDCAFRNASALQNLTVPESVKQVGNNAFAGCSSLASVTYPSSAENFGAIEVGAGNAAFTGNVIFG